MLVTKAYFMRVRNSACSLAVFLVVLATPALLHAQFRDPTPDELKMTADPKAPGASAVYLYREETSDDANHFQTYYERIKVLTDGGKELATVRIPYQHGIDKVSEVEGRTIHADGTVIPLAVKPSDLVDFKTKGFQENTVIFTLPNVEVGSILEYRVKLRYSDDRNYSPLWQVQRAHFAHQEHYSFHPSSLEGIMYAANIGPDAKVVRGKGGTFTLDIADVPPEPEEDWMPPLNTLRWHVAFFYSRLSTGKEFWDTAQKDWATEAQAFTRPTGLLKQAIAQIVSPDDPEEKKAEKIYAAVMKLDNTDFTRAKSEAERKKDKLKVINSAEDVWKNQGGSANEITLLFVALAGTAGLKVWPAQVVNRDRAMFDWGYLSTGQLDDYVAIVELGGKDVYLDPGQKMCPFGAVNWKHTFASGFRLTAKGAETVITPGGNFKDATVDRIADLNIGADGAVTGTVRFVMNGPDALYWRQIALENDEDEVKKRFNESMQDEVPEGVQAEFDHFLGLEDYNTKLMGIVKVSGNIGTSTGKHFFLPGLFFESRAKHPFVAQDKRTTPIDVHFPRLERDDVTYHLPAGFSVESLPQPASATLPDNAVLKIGAGAKGSVVEVQRALAYNFTVLNPKLYPGLHDFYQKVATADQQQLVLTRAPAEKGN